MLPILIDVQWDTKLHCISLKNMIQLQDVLEMQHHHVVASQLESVHGFPAYMAHFLHLNNRKTMQKEETEQNDTVPMQNNAQQFEQTQQIYEQEQVYNILVLATTEYEPMV